MKKRSYRVYCLDDNKMYYNIDNSYNPKRCVFMLNTDIKDKNGNKVYESDFVYYDNCKYVVNYSLIFEQFILKKEDNTELDLFPDTIMFNYNKIDTNKLYVVGNIYENILLKKCNNCDNDFVVKRDSVIKAYGQKVEIDYIEKNRIYLKHPIVVNNILYTTDYIQYEDIQEVIRY